MEMLALGSAEPTTVGEGSLEGEDGTVPVRMGVETVATVMLNDARVLASFADRSADCAREVDTPAHKSKSIFAAPRFSPPGPLLFKRNISTPDD
jgi:hypothetical protein